MKDTIAKIARHTKVDTLQAEIHKLHSTVDSLNQQLHDINIERSYFHDILNSDVAIFVGIITVIATLAVLVSWGVVRQAVLNVEKNLSEKITEINKDFVDFKKSTTDGIATFLEKYENSTHQINRLMYSGAFKDDVFNYALIWAIRTVGTDLKVNKGENANLWMGNVELIVNQKLKKADLESSFTETMKTIDELKELNDEAINARIDVVREKLYQIKYSTATPTS